MCSCESLLSLVVSRPARCAASFPRRRLAPQTQLLEDVPIGLDVLSVQVVQEPAAASDQDQEGAPRVVVLLVHAQVLRELVDAERHGRDLHLCRAGVGLGAAELGRELALALFGEWHEASLVGFLRTSQPGRWQGTPTPAGTGTPAV